MHKAFSERHIGPDNHEQQHMLDTLGYDSLDDLIDNIVPAGIRQCDPLALGEFFEPLPEHEALEKLRKLASRNKVYKSFIGQGYYNTLTPTVVLRNLFENPAWYTAYTPYQPEISQGRLEALLNFQQMITDMTGMDIANASMLDEATAAAEAMTLLLRSSRNTDAEPVFFVADDVLAQTLEVVRTRAEPLGIKVCVGPAHEASQAQAFGVLLQYPGAQGHVHDYRALAKAIHDNGGLVAVAADLLALALLIPPGEWGADAVVGSAQRFGVPMGFGGPHAGYMAVRDAYKRSMPGRLVGVSVDSQGEPSYRLALQTREQHIRREKATSNICTAQALLAIMAAMYAVYHGPDGIKRIAQRVHDLTRTLSSGLHKMGWERCNDHFFDTLTLHTGADTGAIHEAALARGMNLRRIDHERVGISLDETTTPADIEALWSVFDLQGQPLSYETPHEQADQTGIPASLVRQSRYLTHPVFGMYHTEHEMLRYLRRLADKDLALDRTMIPLGSCTMKLNSSTEMIPVSWPEFAHIHPLAPHDQTQGYRQLIAQLEAMLCAVTGYAAVSLQPNAGSQGEYAGLQIISAYHDSRGQPQRKVCLIPSSAHGTNPASAQMVGMQVVVVACDPQGNIDINDLRAKAEQHSDTLAAIMITYPSTHGVFEASVQEVCDIVHQHGGQVYIDGANMNAMVGLAAPGQFGGDVSHLNLHKTFCIPHGGGGPGVGPVAVRAHLAPFLPNHRASGYERSAQGIGAISAAPFGSASLFPISWLYIAMMGATGLTDASRNAILAANYIAARLAPYYPVLYSGSHGLVAHECILDLRPLQKATGISNEDVAKRLIDYGFHAPTMSFPVPGTLMIEPTESEALRELDRFIDAMIAIRKEIAQVESGEFDARDNPLRNAPHTAAMVTADDWPHTYSRTQAAYPLPELRQHKYWPPVGRVDNSYGDRNLFCSCIPIEAYEHENADGEEQVPAGA
ncbi:MAG TPA: aminomethyl-transferring glycine dehydrogenase [Pusillimonas sp.]|uniref:aminomethyl-transferring glycine dehydrogenase n=1 Tax=Pusillimonas sp. TaxID=3040095 RepID=UPI002B6F3123|nr:aminomethyl-transferring glycine dehydrogenase [Pusillimonas sp.]HUH87749.1 aminomethyl-transferring glycine dehydrogenase [Pusillimonas sp.]